MVAVYTTQAETLEEYKERIKHEQEEAEKKKQEEEKNKDKKDEKKNDESCSLFNSCCQMAGETGCIESIFAMTLGVLINVRFADYPYAPGKSFDFATYNFGTKEGEKPPAEADVTDKFWMFELSVDGSYLFGQQIAMYDVQSLLGVELTAFHINVFAQRLWDAEATGLTTFSANAGFSIPIQNFMVSLYAGIFYQDGFSLLVSFGASFKIFFPGHIIFSLYSLFSTYSPFYFIILSPTLEVAINRFTVGVGFNVYDYNNLVLYGPTLKTAIWF
jgi:hypothetical protein